MIKLANKSLCCGCGACVAACPSACITMQADHEGFCYPVIDATRCIECKKCVGVCPSVKNLPLTLPKKCLAAQSKDDALRQSSSSGGLFSLLAERTIEKNGIVFGAAFQDAQTLCHIGIENSAELSRLRGSKYLQSRTEESYRKVLEALKSDRYVFFVGTACQISGLRRFLGREYEKLLCADVVCHGVPSPLVWKKRLRELQTDTKQVQSVDFRDKKTGWRTYSVTYQFTDGSVLSIPSGSEPYMKGFIADLYLRPSCTDCSYKHCGSDLTLGDCWGLETLAPELDDEKGTSIVLVHTEKGERALKAVEKSLKMQSIDYQKACERNPAICRGAKANTKREAFFRRMDEPLSQAVHDLTKVSFFTRCKRKLRAIFR